MSVLHAEKEKKKKFRFDFSSSLACQPLTDFALYSSGLSISRM